MGTFTSAFRPALNKEGFGKLTFLGTSTQSGTKDDGTNWEIFKLNFEVMGAVRGTNQKINIATNYQYSEDNLLGKALSNMGFTPNAIELIEDDAGFMVVNTQEDEDGFESVNDAVPDIEGFLESCKGQVFTAKLNKPTEGKRKGYWEIDVDSLKPFVRA